MRFSNLLKLTLKNDSELAVIYAKAGLVNARCFAEMAAKAAFLLHPEMREV